MGGAWCWKAEPRRWKRPSGRWSHCSWGQDPRRIEHLWQTMYRSPFTAGARADERHQRRGAGPVGHQGKYYGMPVYEMLGGACRDRVRMYGHLKPAGHAPQFPLEDMLAIARKRRDDGFTVVKYSIIPPLLPIETMATEESIVERFAAGRETSGQNYRRSHRLPRAGESRSGQKAVQSPGALLPLLYRGALPAGECGCHSKSPALLQSPSPPASVFSPAGDTVN